MSGGSYDYFGYKAQEAASSLRSRHPDKPHVLALADRLDAIGEVMSDIEWADSGDTQWDDSLDASIRDALPRSDELNSALRSIRLLRDALTGALHHGQSRDAQAVADLNVVHADPALTAAHGEPVV